MWALSQIATHQPLTEHEGYRQATTLQQMLLLKLYPDSLHSLLVQTPAAGVGCQAFLQRAAPRRHVATMNSLNGVVT